MGTEKLRRFFFHWKQNILVYLSIFGPATITAMADNDAAGVATYSIAGATLGYPILFILLIITILLAITQEMGVRLTLVTRKGLADLIREQFGVKMAFLMFICLVFANMGTIVVDLAAMKTVASMFGLPVVPFVIGILIFTSFFVIKGNYKATQNIMLISSFFYLAYIVSAFRAKPDWGAALTNLVFPHGVNITPEYIRNYILIGMGVLGTTITPWGQFFISSFAHDKKIDSTKIRFSQLETYWGAFLTDFFSFFMIVATAATLFVNKIPLVSGEQAALAIKPFAGEFAALLFAFGIFNAGFMGIVIVSLTTAYAFSEFFGLSGSLDSSFTRSKTFYGFFIAQLLVAAAIITIPSISLFQFAITAQTINAMMLPFVFYFLLKFTNNKSMMGEFTNSPLKRNFASVSIVVIVIASLFTVIATFFKF